MHIHKLGFDLGETCDATFTSGHFNPVENYGELSCVNGYFDAADIGSLMWEQPAFLSGAMGIFGRSIVVHNADNARVACCNVECNTEGTLIGTAPEYDLEARCGPVTMGQNATHTWIETTEVSVSMISVQRSADCINATDEFPLVVTPDQPVFFLVEESSIMGISFQLAGTSIQYSIDDGEPNCCLVVLKTAVTNCPDADTPCDTAVSPCIFDPTSPMSSMGSMGSMGSSMQENSMSDAGASEETDFSVSMLASIALLIAALL